MDLSPLPPPPALPIHQHSFSSGNSFPVIAIAVIGILATAFLLVGYYVFVIKCCLTWHRFDLLHRFSSRRRSSSGHLLPIGFASASPDASDDAKGLDEAMIRSIPVIKYRKITEIERGGNTNSNHTSETYECAVCLSEFEDGERLRVIPNCCHAFHIDCIDVWLQSNANCPLCRSWISPSSILHNHSLFPSNSSDNFSGNEEDYVVIEIQGNNQEDSRLVKTEKKKGRKCSMGDEWIDMKRDKDEEFGDVQPIRRSVSMDLSGNRDFCLTIQECSSSSSSRNGIETSPGCSSSSSKLRRSILWIGYGRNSRGSVQPVIDFDS